MTSLAALGGVTTGLVWGWLLGAVAVRATAVAVAGTLPLAVVIGLVAGTAALMGAVVGGLLAFVTSRSWRARLARRYGPMPGPGQVR